MKNLKIGITLALKENNESIWTNGIKQNVLMLVDLLKKSQNNYEVCILNTINLDWSTKPYYLTDIDIFNFKDKFMEMDLLIVMGAQINNTDILKFKEDKNKRIISYKCGNNYILNVEDILFKEEKILQLERDYDELWYIPQLHENNHGYYHTVYRTNSLVVPFLWDAKYLKQDLDEIDESFDKGKYKKNTKYNPNKEKKVIGVMEPNINLFKFALIPALITEESYRTETGKNKIEKLMLTNAEKLGKNKTFMSIIKTFDLFQDNKISADHRYKTSFVTSQYFDVVLSHQLMWNLNYLYLDIAYMGYPILHNAYMVKDLGYYYEGSDTVGGSKMLNWILENHDNHIDEYNEKNKKVIDRYSIHNPTMIETYDKLIFNLFNGGNIGLSYDVMTNRYLNF
jgi:hypothetical protein